MDFLKPLGVLLLAALPATPTYQLNSYGFGSGGTANSSTPTYSLEGTTGEVGGQTTNTPTYTVKPGFVETQQAHVPTISAFDNGSSTYYNKLHFVIGQQGNPSDAKYALQISTTSNFSSGNNYVKSDFTIGPTLTTGDYQTYSTWGGGSGGNIIGLTNNTAYYLRAKATQGTFTESPYGPSATASTVGSLLSFDIDVSASNSETGSPYATNLGTLLPTTVVDSPEKIWFDFETNAANGGNIYIYGQNTGLRSSIQSYTLASSSADLGSISEGYGAKSSSATQSAGGPITAVSPYNQSNDNVGIIDTVARPIYSTSSAITAGRTSLVLKAKSKGSTPAATDYTDIITAVAAGKF